MLYIVIFFVAILLLAIVVLLILGWVITKKTIFGKLIGVIVLGVVGVIIIIAIYRMFTSKKEVTQSDIYGTYTIDRTKFAGRQADWQYNHFRFEITRQNDFLFYVTNEDRIVEIYKYRATFSPYYKIPRIVLQVGSLSHHIIVGTPTLYRTAWSFYYVFNSKKFGNVFFTKGKWKPL